MIGIDFVAGFTDCFVRDTIYHPFDLNGNRHMEYLNDRGDFDDVPIDAIIETFTKEYVADDSLEKSGF
ncbi:MAG: hypothetical protein HF978_05600 [Desulfobacteraceae bacterium]|nr:hypothetical protein [Desulfobacteraceae bacterium]MBC2755007.1 hypothetical protein [Desulfobacteraceae bacterium]